MALPGLYIGLMSGTSLDGIDGVIADIGTDRDRPLIVRAHAHAPFDPALRAELLALNAPGGSDELLRGALAANALARACAAVVERLLAAAGARREFVRALGAHGQTVRHRPELGVTIQLNNPALLAELTGIAVVADFRSRDVAAGGHGAPLVPAFHRLLFARAGEAVAVLNLGGMANLSLLDDAATRGFDCGPGNALMDWWCQRERGLAYDDDGRWAASGRVHAGLLAALLAEPWLALPPPKSTGRDQFNPAWFEPRRQAHPCPAADVQATLAEFSARCAADALAREAPRTRRLIVCGGGALNTHLMRRLASLCPTATVTGSQAEGLEPTQVEAAAFAWLAERCRAGEPGNVPAVTGAAGPRILGAVYRA